MQRVAAEMRHSETAFVARRVTTGRSTCAGSRPRSRSTSAATPRSPVRTCSSRPDASRRRRRSCVPHPQRRVARRARGRGRDHPRLPRCRAGRRRRRSPSSSTRWVCPSANSCGPTASSTCVSSTTRRPCASSRPTSPKLARPDRRARRVRDRAAATQGYDIVSRCFGPKIGIDEDPVTGSMYCVLVAYWGPRLDKTELHAYPGVGPRRRGDRPRKVATAPASPGRATTVLAGELLAGG